MWVIESLTNLIQENMSMLIEGIGDTLYMTFVSSFFAYVLALPLGVALVVTREDGLYPIGFVYRFLDIVVNIGRSVPFLILLVAIQPLTTFLVGKSYGSTATIVPLVVAATPFIARLIESSLQEVDHGVVEAAQSMGASLWTIIIKVLIPEAKTSLIVGATIAVGTILGYSAMAGFVGGGGLGDIAVRYGYYRYDGEIMLITVILMVLLVQVIQAVGMKIARKTDKRVI
ncbi:MAG TPA: ABC transporter permease [Tissierellia bacterium]|jgi:D-methionine transport system permease protein|nr:ABC transporter permease [Tissierellia bacterium]